MNVRITIGCTGAGDSEFTNGCLTRARPVIRTVIRPTELRVTIPMIDGRRD